MSRTARTTALTAAAAVVLTGALLGAPQSATAQPAPVAGTVAAPAAGSTVTATATHSLSGKLVTPLGKVVAGVEVTAYDTTTAKVVSTSASDEYGYYYLDEVPNGTFRIVFHDPAGATPDNEWPDPVTITAEHPEYLSLDSFMMAMGDLKSLTAPTISGSGRLGTTLTASPGKWNATDGTTFQYTWYANGKPKDGGRTFKPLAWDLGSKITVDVHASNPAWREGQSLRSATVVISKANTSITAKALRSARRNTPVPLRVDVNDPSTRAPHGRVEVWKGTRFLGSAYTTDRADGVVRVKAYGLAKVGKHTLTVKWPGGQYSRPSSTTVRVTITR